VNVTLQKGGVAPPGARAALVRGEPTHGGEFFGSGREELQSALRAIPTELVLERRS
jgi:hypothetical protein